MQEPTILIVSDDNRVAHLWGLVLAELRCMPVVAGSYLAALRTLDKTEPELIVVDVTQRATDGVTICAKLYGSSGAPILLLTPVNNESYMLEAYSAGVDECVIKPVSPALFLAKIKALLRRSQTVPIESLEHIKAGDLTLQPMKRELLTAGGSHIGLTQLEFRVLHLLMNHPDRAFSSDEIVQLIWGVEGGSNSALVKNVIYRLRKKIEPKPGQMRYLRTETGGYLFRR
jgi:two-component system OmpR family response regulator